MFQINAPKRLVGHVKLWCSLLLVILTVFFSFAPIITLDLGDEEVVDGINSMMQEVLGEQAEEIPAEIDVTAGKMFGCVGVIAKIVSVAMETAESGDGDKAAEELTAMLDDKETKDTLLLCFSIANTLMNAFKTDEGNDGGAIAMVLNMLVIIIALFYMLIATMIAPIIFIIVALTALFPALKNAKTPENAAGAVGKKLPGLLTFPLTIILFQSVIPGMRFGSGVLTIWILAIVSVVLNLVASRLRVYDKNEFKYANVLQGASIVGIVGFIVFFFNIIKTDIFSTFTGGKWGQFVVEAAAILANDGTVDTKGYIIDAVLIMVYLVLVLSSSSYIAKCAQRLSLSMGSKKNRAIKDTHLVSTILLLFIYIIPTYIAGSKNYYENPAESSGEGTASFLELAAEQKSALTAVLVGIILMLVAEIAIVVLKKVFCSEITLDEKIAVMTGTTKTPEEKLAEAEALVANAHKTVETSAEEK